MKLRTFKMHHNISKSNSESSLDEPVPYRSPRHLVPLLGKQLMGPDGHTSLLKMLSKKKSSKSKRSNVTHPYQEYFSESKPSLKEM